MPDAGTTTTTDSHEGARDGVRAWYARWRSDLLLAAVVLLVVAPVMQPLMAQQASRYALTAALWEQGSVAVDDYAHLLTVDQAERGGRTYSDKAPGQPVLAVPAYALYRLVGGHSAAQARPFADPGLWAVSLWSAAIPAALLAVAMRRLALRVSPPHATAAALSLALGTMLLPFATVLFSHVLSALLGLVAYLLLSREGARAGDLAGAGLLAGVAVTVEYTLALLVVVVGVASLAAHRLRTAWFVVGGLLPAVLLGVYHTVAFGGPFRPSYRYSRFAAHQEGLVGAQLPRPQTFLAVVVGERGLFVLTPIVLVGLVGVVLLVWRARGRRRRDAVVALACFTAFVALMSGWSNPFGGASPGPRYVVPALPFLAGGVAWVWDRQPAVPLVAAALGAVTMGLGTFTLPLAQPTEPSALLHWVGRLADGRVADTLLTAVMGTPWAIVLPLSAAVLVATVLLTGERERRRAQAAGPAA